MESRRLVLFILLSMGVLLLWQHYFMPPPAPQEVAAPKATPDKTVTVPNTLGKGQRIIVTTDTLRAEIDTYGADLRVLDLLEHDSANDANKPFELLTDKNGHVYVAQTGLLADNHPALPTHKTLFNTAHLDYRLSGEELEVPLSAPTVNGIKVTKTYLFKRNSYEIGVRYNVTNTSKQPLAATAYYRLLRDSQPPDGETHFVSTFTGPVVYTADEKFQKVSFDELDKGKAEYAKHGSDSWIGIIQHYFMSAWIMQPLSGDSLCKTTQQCTFQMEAQNGLYSVAALVTLPSIAPAHQASFTVPLYAGPEEYDVITKIAAGMQYAKDYGVLYLFASPLFWLLTKLHALVGNWGWAIVLLTLIIKTVFTPLTAASYRSMAKMKALAPRLERLKAQAGDDRMKFQKAVMEMYKTEKINPLGGCLPMLIQIPVFIGLYWALLSSVELRQAPWILWIHDLARPDPYFVLPAMMAITMYAQSLLNPAPTDPMQAKMMKIMPVAFSVMFFFFPAGLVLYYLLNSLLSIAQQWYINRQIEQSKK